MNFTFSMATQADAENVLALYRRLLGTEGCVWTEDYPNEREVAFDLSRDCLFCMKTEAGELAGVISIDDDPQVSELPCWSEDGKPMGEISRVGVDPRFQGNGLARKMVLGVMEVLQKRGYRSAVYLVCKTNEKANRAYAGLNFATVGETTLWGHAYWCCEKQLQEEAL